MRKRKEDLSERLRDAIKLKRKEPELVDLRASIKGLEYRLKYSRQNRELAETKTLPQLESECAALEKESVACAPSIERIEARLAERAARIASVRGEGERAEDEIFAAFCRDIGVANIRVYEERELAGQQANVKRRMQFEEAKTRLDTQLEFERSRDTAKAYLKWQREVEAHEAELAKLRAEEQASQAEIDKCEAAIEAKRAEAERRRAVADQLDAEIGEAKKRAAAQTKELNEARKRLSAVEAKLLDKRLERHGVLKSAKMELVKLPMLSGTMEDISDEEPLPTNTQSATQTRSVAHKYIYNNKKQMCCTKWQVSGTKELILKCRSTSAIVLT